MNDAASSHPARTTLTARASCRFGAHAALLTFVGALVSGPAALVLVTLTHPQPPWRDADLFVRSYHVIQTFPYFCGFVLVSGFAVLLASLHDLAEPELRVRTTCALVFTAAFASLVSLNYVLQTTLVPALVQSFTHDDAALLTWLTMSNPRSLGWALEMWGYGFLGAATWLIAPVFSRTPLERWTARAFIANGPMSIAPAFVTAIAPGWELTTLGVGSFIVWNLLVLTMTPMALIALRRRAALSS